MKRRSLAAALTRRGTRGLAVGARAAALALGLAALAAAWLPRPLGPIHLLVLIDASASLPGPWVDQAWSELVPALAGLPRGSRLSVVRFGTHPVVEWHGRDLDTDPLTAGLKQGPPHRLAVDDSATAIGAALDAARRLPDPGESALVLLISDGDENLGRAQPLLHALARRGVPVRWWDPGAGRTPADAEVRALTVTAGTPPTATVELAANTPLDAQVQVTLDDRVLLSRPLTLDPGRPVRLDLDLERPAPGSHLLTAILRASGDLRPANDRRALVLSVPGPPRVGYLAGAAGPSPAAAALAAGGWDLERLDAAGVDPARLATPLITSGVLILDGIRPADLEAAAWTAIEQAVTRQGTGLLLLGGPGTFGAGGYRHSVLEGLLPVTAEAPERSPAAAVIFALDTSGSMAQPTRYGTTRLDLAGSAVAAAARALGPHDQSAVIGFDVEARVLKPLAPRGTRTDTGTDTATEAAVGTLSPGGGTRLRPAVLHALDLLGPEAPQQRLLVLLSDGQITDPETIGELAQRLAAARVQVSVIALGDASAGEPLRALAQTTGGRYQVAGDLLALPQLTQAEIERRTDPVVAGPLTPRVVAALPLAVPPPPPWPEVLAYPVTRPRAGARVYLAAPNGDPLLAAWRAGSGRVVALPAGLGAWAPDWPAWSHWPEVLGGLVDWTAGGSAPAGVALDLQADGTARLRIEGPGASGQGSAPAPLAVRVLGPDGLSLEVQAGPVAPGRYAATLPAAPAGHYRILAAGDWDLRADLWYQPDLEFRPAPGPAHGLAAALAAGLVTRWTPAQGALPVPRQQGRLPATLVLGALVMFLAGLLVERLPIPRRPTGRVGH